MSKKVIIFTYYWPPAGGVAVQRFLKFSKFLPEFGWEPIIITVDNGSYPYLDESLVKEISPSLRVYRTKTFEPFEFYNLLRGKKGKSLPVVSVGSHNKKSFFQTISEYVRANFFIPDARKGWVSYAVKQAEEISRLAGEGASKRHEATPVSPSRGLPGASATGKGAAEGDSSETA